MYNDNNEFLMASYVTYKELYANDNCKSSYQILAEFIKYVISTEQIYSFSIPELRMKMQSVFGFEVPIAVLKSALRRIEFIHKIPNSEAYAVNRDEAIVDEKFSKYIANAERENGLLTKQLLCYAEKRRGKSVCSEELIQEFVAYILDESNGNRYQDIISAFILENEKNKAIVSQLNAIREGSILYMGLNYNINELGSMQNDLTLFLDTEVLFNIMGYNGEVYKTLTVEMIDLVKEANQKKARVKLRYFEETKKEIQQFFGMAAEIVRRHSYVQDKAAMKAIINGCENTTDVSDKEADFFYKLQYAYGIVEDEKTNYYTVEDYISNLEGDYEDGSDEDIEESYRYLSHINKLRKNKTYQDYTKVGYLFVTETRRTLELARKLAAKDLAHGSEKEDGATCTLAVTSSFLTNLLWYKMNKGFGGGKYPQNIDSVLKAKIVLSNYITQNIAVAYETYKKQHLAGELTTEQMAARLLGLREKALRPEEITSENLVDNLNFDPNYIGRYEEERELQQMQLQKKDEIIQQLTDSHRVSLNEAQLELSKTNDELVKMVNAVEDREKTIVNQKQIIAEKDAELEQYRSEKRERQKKKDKFKKICIEFGKKFLICAIAAFLSYWVALFIKADKANVIMLIITGITIALQIVGYIKKTYKKIFKVNTPITEE